MATNSRASTAELLKVEHVADFYHRYPGEEIKLQTRLKLEDEVGGMLLVTVSVPENVEPMLHRCFSSPPLGRPYFGAELDIAATDTKSKRVKYRQVIWQVDGAQLSLEQPYDFVVMAKTLLSDHHDACYRTWAEVTQSDQNGSERQGVQSTVVTLHVQAKPQAMDFMPSIYHQPEHAFMWRYLMFFDRVWGRYEELLRNQAAYFDPRLTPVDFLPWLAAYWVGLPWDERLPKPVQQRVYPNLILKMLELQRKRGTAEGLREYLQIWLNVADEDKDQYIRLQENVAGNFILGEQTRLGDELVLGGDVNKICHFTVTLKWPPGSEPLSRDFIETLIEAWKPAHTTYQLNILN